MSIDPDDFKPVKRKCVECGAPFYVPASCPTWAEPETCYCCDELDRDEKEGGE